MSELLSGLNIVPVISSAAVLANELSEAGAIEESRLVSGIQRAELALGLASDKLNALLDADTVVTAVNANTPAGRTLSRFIVSSAITAFGVKAADALTVTAGIESEGVDGAGIEAWSSIKEVVANAIDFVIKKFKEFKKFVMKYFNKFFGDVERLKKKWEGIKSDAESKLDGYKLEKNTKIEFTSNHVDAFHTSDNAVVKSTKELVAGAVKYGKLAEAIENHVVDVKAPLIETDSIEKIVGGVSDGIKLLGLDKGGVFGKALAKLEGSFEVTTESATSAAVGKATGVKGDEFLGRKTLVLELSDADAPTLENIAKSTKVSLRDSAVNDAESLTKIKSVKIEGLEAAEVIEVADANIELATQLISLKRSKALDKSEVDLDKLTKSLDGWKKDVPAKEDDNASEIANYKTGVKVVTAYHTLARRFKLDLPLAVCKEARLVSIAQASLCAKSLTKHKKES